MMEDGALSLGTPGRGPAGASRHRPGRSQGARSAPGHRHPAAPAAEHLPPPARPRAPARRGEGPRGGRCWQREASLGRLGLPS